MIAHPIPRGTRGGCLADATPAQYAVDFGGGKLFEICGACFATVFGKPAPDALARLSKRSTTAEARKAFKSWAEHLGAIAAAKQLGGSFE